MKPSLDDLWSELESSRAGAGILKRLVSADWVGDLSVAVIKPENRRALVLDLTEPVEVDIDSLSKSEYVQLQTAGDPRGVLCLQLVLADPKFQDHFSVLAQDLLGRVLSTSNEADGARALVHQLARWLKFLKRRRPDVLSYEAQLGLYGELAVLYDHIGPAVGLPRAIEAWTGPDGSYQDFEMAGIAIEVKTLSATRPQQLRIETERQLDDRGLAALVLAHLAVERRRGAGRSLPDLVQQIRALLDERGESSEVLDEKLFLAGYLEAQAHLYAQNGYVERRVAFYRVSAGFPRLVEDDLPPGIGHVRYLIDASACEPHRVEAEQVASWLREPPDSEDVLREDESAHLEFKASAWRSLNPDIPSKVVNEAIIKSVAGLLNAEGGELVIGVEDRSRAVLGIEPDLSHLGGIDRDAYENLLTSLLIKSLGEAATRSTRIRFEMRDDKTICVVRVRASARPVFGESPVSKGKRFWVRVNNSTREFSDKEMVDYIRDNWG